MAQNSRISKYEQKRALIRTAIAIGLILFIIAGAVYFLPQIIIGAASLANSFSGSKTSTAEKKDNIAPIAPVISELPKATSAGVISAKVSAEPNSNIILYVNGGRFDEQVADSEGKAVFSAINLSEGENILYARAEDKASNVSPKSKQKIIILKTRGPSMEIKYKIDNKNDTVNFSGSTENDAVLTINGIRAIVARDGSFEKIIKLNNGENVFKVESKDTAGNIASEEITIAYSSEVE